MPMSKPIARRHVLRGAGGVALGLPFLQAMLPRRADAQAAAGPRRLLVWSQPDGTIMERWAPKVVRSETDFQLSEVLSPFERHKSDMVIVRNLRATNHAHTYTGLLTGRQFIDDNKTMPNGKQYGAGISLDQYVAQKWAGQTAVPSLHLGVVIDIDQDSGSCVSWQGPRKPVVAENNPFRVFSNLFMGTSGSSTGTPNPAAERLARQRKSIIDSILVQSAAVSKRVGVADRAAIENYLESVRGAEKQLAALSSQKRGGSCAPPNIGSDPSVPGKKQWWMDPAKAPEILALQMQLAVAALACDTTRVVTLTLACTGAYNRIYGFIPGVDPSKDWHGWSHYAEGGKDKDIRASDNTVAIEKWHYENLAKMLDQMKGVVQPNGKSLLADSLLLLQNEYGTNGIWTDLPGNPADGKQNNFTHASVLMPYVLFGQAGGTLKTGRHLTYDWLYQDRVPKDANERAWAACQASGPWQTQLLVSMLNALGIPDQTFGDPTKPQGPLPRLL